MDNSTQILSNLIAIKWLLIILSIILFLIGLNNALRSFLSVKKQIREYKENEFTDRVDQFLNENELEKADKLINEKLSELPNHSYATYYFARLQYIKKDYEGCTKTLNRLLELTPQWKEEYIIPILDQIEEIRTNN